MILARDSGVSLTFSMDVHPPFVSLSSGKEGSVLRASSQSLKTVLASISYPPLSPRSVCSLIGWDPECTIYPSSSFIGKSLRVCTFSQSCRIWLVTLNLPFLFSRPVHWKSEMLGTISILSLPPEEGSAQCVFSLSCRIVMNAKSRSPLLPGAVPLYQKLHFSPLLRSTGIVTLHSIPLGYAATESLHLLPLLSAAPRHSNYASCLSALS